MKKTILCVLAAALILICAGPASATVDQAKTYKKTFGLDKLPKCITCHAVEKPKKDENHDLNEYGKKIKALGGDAGPTEETYKQAGPAPEK